MGFTLGMKHLSMSGIGRKEVSDLGEAKRRGTLEERKAQAIIQQKLDAEKEKTKKEEMDALKTLEDPNESKNRAMLLALMSAARKGSFPIKRR